MTPGEIMNRTVLAGVLTALCFMAIPASLSFAEWGKSTDKVKTKKLGRFWGNALKYELRTRPATIRSSHVRLKIFWYNRAAKKDEEQVLFDDERKAQFEQYTFKYDRPNKTIFVSYFCPKNRKDKETTCTERWLYHEAKNQFVLKEKTSTNPQAKSRKKILALIQSGKLSRANKEIKTLMKVSGKKIETDDFFAAFFLRIHQKAYAEFKAGKFDKAETTLNAFLKSPPVHSPKGCPDKDKLLVCLDGKTQCGCSERFAHLPATAKYAKRMAQLGKIWAKKKRHKRIIGVIGPMADLMPEESNLHLLLADAYWAVDFKTKARKHYKIVRQIRLADRTFMPKRVFERFKAP